MGAEIETLTKYAYNRVEYKSLQDVKTAVENSLGAIIDGWRKDTIHLHLLTPSQRLELFNCIVKDKKKLIRLLQVEFEEETDSLHSPKQTNILDL